MERHADPDADFDAFFHAAFPRLVAIARRVTGDRCSAEDAALEAMIRAHRRWKRVSTYERPDGWVARVALNEALRRLPKDFAPAEPAPVADPAENVALRQSLAGPLAGLPRRQREVIALRFLVDLPETGIAALLQISHGTVKTHLRRGLQRLRLSIGPESKEEDLARLP